MLFKKREKNDPHTAKAESLDAVVESELSGADVETVRIVTAIAGLLASVAYADRRVTAEEEQVLERELSRIQGLDAKGVRAIHAALTKDLVSISTIERPRYTRALVELADRDLRRQVLEVLIDLAAADGSISLVEVTMLRTLTTSLALSQDDYNELQARHRDKLESLR